MTGIEIAMLAGTALSAGGTVATGIAANKAGKIEAWQHEMEGKQAGVSAIDEENAARRQVAEMDSSMVAINAATGADMGPSFNSIREANFKALEGDLRKIQFNKSTNVFNAEMGARMARAAGKSAMLGGVLKGAGTMIGGATDAYKSYKAGQK